MQRALLQRNAAMHAAPCMHARVALRATAAPLRHQNRCQVPLAAQASSVSVTEQAVTEQPATAAVKEGQITELDKDTFYPFLENAQDTLVLVDYFTDWCGPCKMIYPELVKMAAKYEGRVLFTKVNCNKTNKDLGIKLAIKVAPTFHLYRRSQKVAEMTGAKVDKLKALIEQSL